MGSGTSMLVVHVHIHGLVYKTTTGTHTLCCKFYTDITIYSVTYSVVMYSFVLDQAFFWGGGGGGGGKREHLPPLNKFYPHYVKQTSLIYSHMYFYVAPPPRFLLCAVQPPSSSILK